MDTLFAQNRLLGALPAAVADTLQPDLVHRPLDAGQVLIAQDERATTIWFPLSGAVSLTPETLDGDSAQATVIGREGLLDVTTALSYPATSAPWRATVVIPGIALAMDVDRFRSHLGASRPLFTLTHGYVGRIIAQLGQSTVCGRFHSVRERAARWLLVLHDRAEGDTFPLTQQALADMVGAHRPTLSLVAHALSDEGLIEYSRGVIAVVNRPGLVAAACECYARSDAHFDRVPRFE